MSPNTRFRPPVCPLLVGRHAIECIPIMVCCASQNRRSCTPTLRIIPLLPKPGKMPSSQHMWEGATPWYHTILSIISSCLHSSGSCPCSLRLIQQPDKLGKMPSFLHV